MTNEQLADFIAQGGNDELIPLLWEKTRQLFRGWSVSFYQKYKERCDITGVCADDLFSESYIAFLDAIRYFGGRSEESRELSFLTFCKYPFMRYSRDIIGLRTKRQRSEPLNNWESLDKPLINSEGDETSRLELLPDERAEQAFEQAIDRISNEQEHELIKAEMQSRLDQRQSQVLILRYWQNKTLKETAAALGISIERTRQLERKSLRLLRKSKALRQLFEINYYTPCSVSSFQKYGSSVERIVEIRERLREQLGQELADKFYTEA